MILNFSMKVCHQNTGNFLTSLDEMSNWYIKVEIAMLVQNRFQNPY